jgi:hypothetical protein
LQASARSCRQVHRSCRQVPRILASHTQHVPHRIRQHSIRRADIRIAYATCAASHTQHVPHVSVSLSIFLSLSLSLRFLCLSACLSSVSLSLSLSHIHTHKHTQIYQAVSIYTSIVFIIYNLYLYLGKTRNTVAVCPLYCPSTTLTTSLEPIVCCSESRATAACVCVCVCVSIRQHTSAYVSIREATCLWRSSCAAARQHTSAYVSIRQHT